MEHVVLCIPLCTHAEIYTTLDGSSKDAVKIIHKFWFQCVKFSGLDIYSIFHAGIVSKKKFHVQ